MNGDLAKAPRWFLLLLAGGCVALAVGWAAHVEAHISESGQGYQRIARQEARADALEWRVAALEAHAAWCRRQHGDTSRAAEGSHGGTP